jgi:hypothetical protein
MDMRLIQFAALALPLVLLAPACEQEQTERTREMVDDAARKAEQGADQARQGVEQGLSQARDGVEQGMAQARDGVEQGMAQAREGVAQARERYAVDDRLEEARQRLSASMDDAAASFNELADAGRSQAEDLSASFEAKSKASFEGAAEAIRCEPEPKVKATTRCSIGQELLAKLGTQPKLLARELMLLPKRGKTGSGLELVRLHPEGIPALLGFHRNDILLEINGVSLGSLDAIRSVDEALQGKSEAELVFEREGKRKTVVIEPER